MFGVEGIPTFVVLGADGTVLNANARGNMAAGPEAAGTNINECPSIVVMCEGAAEAEQKAIEAALEPLAKGYIEEAKRTGEDPKYIFLMATGGGPMDQLRALTEKEAGPAMKAATTPLVLLFDIPDQGGFYLAPTN